MERCCAFGEADWSAPGRVTHHWFEDLILDLLPKGRVAAGCGG